MRFPKAQDAKRELEMEACESRKTQIHKAKAPESQDGVHGKKA